MISHKHRCIFIHIPKCGGSSIEEAIWPGPRSAADLWKGKVNGGNKYQEDGLQHLKAVHIREEVGKAIFDSYFKFAIIRNPFDKAVSQYTYAKQQRPDFRAMLGVSRFVRFATYLKKIQQNRHVHWEKQKRFICDASGHLMVDFIGRFETLHADFAAIARTIGLPPQPLPHATKSVRVTDYRHYYTDRTRALVASLYGEDIDMFRYEY